ncbi:MAG: hypothetical protein U5L09_03680 [Bacteroidales bacterium]|nr:hypothetical protein [Bacteroidales bacterium]
MFWHKNEAHKTIIKCFNEDPPDDLEDMIYDNATYAKEVIKKWVEENEIDLIIAHNTSHPYNFITAVGLGIYFEELKANNYMAQTVGLVARLLYGTGVVQKSQRGYKKISQIHSGHLRGWNCMHQQRADK